MENDKIKPDATTAQPQPERILRRAFPVLVVLAALSVVLSIVNLARPTPSLWVPLAAVVLVVATVSVWRWLRSRW